MRRTKYPMPDSVPSPSPVSASDDVKESIRDVIAAYKADWETVESEEAYKWKALFRYRQYWDLNAPDFAAMLKKAFDQTGNLLAANNYYALKMLVSCAQQAPEKVRKLFSMLYDEKLPLEERFKRFQEGFQALMQTQARHHYQDLHAVSVYLSFEYPEKYFIYKSSIYNNFRELVGFEEELPTPKNGIKAMKIYMRLCNLIVEEIKNDPDLIALHDGMCRRIEKNMRGELSDPESSALDSALHLRAMDIAYYGSRIQEDEAAPHSSGQDYYPSPEEYDPHIRKEAWLTLLNDPSVATSDTLTMLKRMLELGGESSRARLAEIYGKRPCHYNLLGWTLGKKVKKALHLPDPADKHVKGFYIIPFVGKYVEEGGKKRYAWKLREELREALMTMNASAQTTQQRDTDISLNTILYGPPGTGKTYSAALSAVAAIEKKKLAEVEQEEPAEVFRRYTEYRKQGRIAFTTFHQSYGYEEFIEGIRPVPLSDDEEEDADLQYRVEAGVFKRFCEKAERPKSVSTDGEHFGISDNPTIWKVSLEGSGDNPTRTECLQNGHIRIGWDAYGPDITDETNFSPLGGKKVLNAFINRMNVGDIVLSCYSASTIDAIGVVTGEYEWHNEYDEYKRLRKVNWIVKGIRKNIVSINGGKTMTLSSVYRLGRMALPDVYTLINEHLPAAVTPARQESENYVFIIDEINRGNISKIFGELITLLEEGRRTGNMEETRTVLPYSQQTFGIPKNVYVLGTMNTADRSIALMDTALRRRFRFREMMPRPELLQGVMVEGIDIAALLDMMNRRITVLYDREHTIGHAYFLPLKENPTLDMLATIFKNCILPLLQEYFYEDYEKIRLVLGDNQKNGEPEFLTKAPQAANGLFGEQDVVDFDEVCIYGINDAAFGNREAYRYLQ